MSSIKSLIAKRGAFKRFMGDFSRYIEDLPQTGSKLIIKELEARLNTLKIKYDQYTPVQEQLYELDEDNLNDQINEATNIDNSYFQLMSRAQIYIEAKDWSDIACELSEESGPQLSNTNVKLPTIELPSFDGDYTKWRSFDDTFKALIDSNTALNNIQKLCYLRSSLKGDASGVISALETTAENY